MTVLWDYYVRNVDVMVKVLYKPTVENLVKSASKDLGHLDSPAETLLFAIWFATVNTMSSEECNQLHNQEKAPVLQRYRFALEEALAQAEWMTTQDTFVLQALTLHIVSLSFSSGIWSIIFIALGLRSWE